MPGPISVAVFPDGRLVQCHLCPFTQTVDTDAQADTVVVEHLDAAHPDVSDD